MVEWRAVGTCHALREVDAEVHSLDALDGERLLDHPLGHLEDPEERLILSHTLASGMGVTEEQGYYGARNSP